MQEVIEIFKKLQSTSGKKDKEKILIQNSKNDLFKECLVFLLDDNIQTGLKKKSLEKAVQINSDATMFYDFSACMKYLMVNNTGRDIDIFNVQEFIKTQPKDNQWFYIDIVTKSLKCGVSKKTVNKVLGNIIFEWKVQLGSPYDKLKLKKNEKFYLSQKLNGCRFSVSEGCGLSRQGKPIDGLEHIIKDIFDLNLDTYFLDGELIRKNIDNVSDNENFRLTTSIVNAEGISKEELQFVIFDMFPVETIVDGKTIEKYEIRKQRLLDLKKIIEQKAIKNLSVVDMVYEGSDTQMITKWLDKSVDLGWEGLMLNKNTPYEFKRTTNLIKIKKFYDIALKCVDINIANTGKYKGILGSITCKYGDGVVDCGSGFTDEDREHYAKCPNDIIGKIVSIKYKEESQNKDGNKSLQFPIFNGIVHDKSVPDDE